MAFVVQYFNYNFYLVKIIEGVIIMPITSTHILKNTPP